MAYKTYREEIMDKWRDLDLPTREAIEVLRAALALKEEELQAKYEVQEQNFLSLQKKECETQYDTPEFWELYHKFCDAYNALIHMCFLREQLESVICDFHCRIIPKQSLSKEATL